MSKISSGIKDVDSLIDSVHIGDNVVWEVEAGTSEDIFMRHFLNTSLSGNKDVIYVSFNKSPQSILLHMNIRENSDRLTILDCFTSGKGKSDRAFQKFYETDHPEYPKIIRVNRPADIVSFTETVNSIQDGLSDGARYVFDSLTGMQDLWGDESSTYKFFTYMCPRLYDLGTVAFWILEKEAHSQSFKANLRHITQVVLELYKKKDKLFIKALKLEGRSNREAFKPHAYEIEDNNIFITPPKKEPSLGIGSKIREARIRMDMSQRDLADKIGLTSSFISQLENNQISPSLNSFVQIAEVLGVNPALLLHEEPKPGKLDWLIPREDTAKSILKKEPGYTVFTVHSGSRASVYRVAIEPSAELKAHFLSHKKEEHIHILKGGVSVTVNGIEKELRPGDSVVLTDALPSAWKSKSQVETELLVLCI